MAKKILVVDDKANMGQLLQDYLSEQGFAVATAANGREALYAARRDNPDVVLLDLMMPEMDGFEFLQQYRRERGLPVIILTARLDESDTVLGLERTLNVHIRNLRSKINPGPNDPQYIETVFGVGYRLRRPEA